MKTFTIESQTNHITAHPTAQGAKSIAGAKRFAAAALAGLAAHWPHARLVEIWNNLPGATPVRKFKDRATAVSRIWKAMQNLGEAVPVEATQQPAVVPTIDGVARTAKAALQPEALADTPVAPQTPGVAPEALPARTNARRANQSPVATKTSVRRGSKTATILDLLNRPGGASLKDIMQATGWLPHSVRGFISGTVGKRMSLTVVSTRTGDGERSYFIEA